jgi:predicted esterase
MHTLSIETPTHGRVLVEEAAGPSPAGLLVAFHGYAQAADDTIAEVGRIPGSRFWRIASVQGLHRFYARRDENVVASWMTRQDREAAIRDNLAYVERVLDAVETPGPLVFAGFSQGASMAYRAAILGRRAAAGVLSLGGDIPPDVKTVRADRPWPAVLIGVGDRETWYTPSKVATDLAFLESRGIGHEVCRFAGGHEWTEQFREAAAAWLDRLAHRVNAPARSRPDPA